MLENKNMDTISKLRKSFDKQDMFKSICSFPYQIKESFDIEMSCYNKNTENFQVISKDISSVIICGMGGSAIGGEFARITLIENGRVPIVINRSNIIPDWIDDKTLVVILSYSGNTYETIDAYNKVRQRTTKIIAISSKGGLLDQYCLKNNHIRIDIPPGFQPRCALGYISSTTILLLMRLNLIKNYQEIKKQLKLVPKALKSMNLDKAMSLANYLNNTTPIIYGRENYSSVVALRFKNQLQENSKMMAFSNNYPEINHNEIVGLNANSDNFTILWLEDSFLSENSKIDKSISAANEIIDQSGIPRHSLLLNDLGQQHNCDSNSKSSKSYKLLALYESIYFLDWVSYYLALLNNVNPSSIKNIEHIKKRIS